MNKSEAISSSSSGSKSLTNNAAENFIEGINKQILGIEQYKTENRDLRRQNMELSKQNKELRMDHSNELMELAALRRTHEELTKRYESLTKKRNEEWAELKEKKEDLDKLRKTKEDQENDFKRRNICRMRYKNFATISDSSNAAAA
uniref:Uncharacterized protein n=1 Tax=Oryza brachyantha TaxID=4533 RepID=J3LVI5_ORYBR